MSATGEADIDQRIDAIEAAYEYMLAYAAQGLNGDEPGGSVTQIREELTKAEQAMDGIAGQLRTVAQAHDPANAARYNAFIDVLERDADIARAAIHMVLVQPRVSSQLIDNLNALTHLRALLTDMFLVDEVLKIQRSASAK